MTKGSRGFLCEGSKLIVVALDGASSVLQILKNNFL